MAYFPTAAFWSVNPPHDRDRITHHRTKRHDQRQQEQYKDLWTWEEILDREVPGEYNRPKAELEAAKAERRRYEELARRQEKEPTKDLGYTTWEEIDRWAINPGRVPEPAWDSLVQCEEGYRRMEAARRRGRKPVSQTQTFLGGGYKGVWRSQVGDLRQLPELTVESGSTGRHRVMR